MSSTSSAVSDSGRPAPSSLWRDADFRRLWVGQTVSQLGEQTSLVVLPLLAVLTLDIGADQLGVLRAVGQAPILLFSLFVGAWVDRWRTRTVMVLADVGRTLVLGIAAGAGFLDLLGLPTLFVVVFAAGVLSVHFDVAYQASLVRLVTHDQLVRGNSALEGSRSAAQIGGPALGGALVSLLSAPIAVAFGALFFALSFLSVRRIRRTEAVPERSERPPRVWRRILEGLRFVAADSLLRTVCLASAAFNFFLAAMMTVYLLFLPRELHLSGTAVGLALAATGPGALVGSMLAARLPSRFGYGTVLVSAAVLGDGAFVCARAARIVGDDDSRVARGQLRVRGRRTAGERHRHGRPAGRDSARHAGSCGRDDHVCRHGADPAGLSVRRIPRSGVGVALQPPGDGRRHVAVPGVDGSVPARTPGRGPSSLRTCSTWCRAGKRRRDLG